MNSIIRLFIMPILSIVILSSCEFEVTTAHIENITICSALDGEICESGIAIFNPTDPTIHVSCKLKNAPNNTLVTFIWKYTEGEEPIIIDEITLNSSDKGINLNMHTSLSKPYNDWPIGKYEIEITIHDSSNAPLVKYFEIR